MQETRCTNTIWKDIGSEQLENSNPHLGNNELCEGDGKASRPSTVMVTYPPMRFSMDEMKKRREHRLSVFLEEKSSSLQKRSAAR
jgi:hypothetical protein